jgi:hypothetical protein
MKLMTLSLALTFALAAPMAWAKSQHKPHHISRAQAYSNLKWMGGAGATPGPGGGNTPVTTGTQAFGANGMPGGPTNISGTGPSTSGAGPGGGGGGGGGGNR